MRGVAVAIFYCSFWLALYIQPVHAQETHHRDWLYMQSLGTRYPDSAFSLLKEMYGKAIAGKDSLTTGLCLQQMAQICYYLGYYPKALEFHQRADKIFRQTGQMKLVARNLDEMGTVYYYNRQLPIARTQYDEALSIWLRNNDAEGLADSYGRLGHLYEKQHQYDSAFYFQRLALQQYHRLLKKQGIAKIYENIGSIYEDLEQYDSAWHYFNASLELYTQTGDQVASIEVLNNLGDIYRKTNRHQQALDETRRSLMLAEKVNDLYEKGAAYRDLGKTWLLLHQPDSAYYYAELSRKAAIDIYSTENNRQTAFLTVLFDIDKKNSEIKQLESERRVTIISTIAIIIVVVLLGVMAALVISRQRLKIINERMKSEQHRHIYETQKDLMQAELANRQLQEDRLMQELDIKKKGLTSYTLHIIQKNQLLEDLRHRLDTMIKDDKRDQKKQLQQLIQQISLNFNHDQYWNEFRETFEQVHQQFFDTLKKHSTDLTGNDLRMLSLIKLNLASKDIATLLGISQDSLRVSRYRLKKKLNLDQEESLAAFVQSL